jgi:hypothetical protein
MTQHPLNNPTSQAERRKIITGEPTTFHQIARETVDDAAGGRFAKQSPSIVIGSTAVPMYPAASHAQSDPCGPEMPLGYAIDAMEPTGSYHEIQASIAKLGASAEAEPSVKIGPLRRRF